MRSIETISKTVELFDEQYETLTSVAERAGETPQHLLARMVGALASTQGTVYFTDDELLRALGADEQELDERTFLCPLTHDSDLL